MANMSACYIDTKPITYPSICLMSTLMQYSISEGTFCQLYSLPKSNLSNTGLFCQYFEPSHYNWHIHPHTLLTLVIPVSPFLTARA